MTGKTTTTTTTTTSRTTNMSSHTVRYEQDGVLLEKQLQLQPPHPPQTKLNDAKVGGAKLTEFEILYDEPSTIFSGGDTITGKLRIVLREPMKMRLIKLQFKGRICCAWSENKLTNDGTAAKQNCKNERILFDKEIVLLERRPGQELPAEFVLPAGIHVLPFIFPLPKNLPTSFEGEHGSIRCFCRASIVKPWKHDHVAKRAFTILSSPTSAVDAGLLKPIASSEVKTLTSCCCLSGHVSCEISLPKQAYAPGETIFVGAKISNDSRKQITKAAVRLVQLVTYKIASNNNQKGEKSVSTVRAVAEKLFERPLQNGKLHWNQEPIIRVPSTAPSYVADEANGAMIRIEYELRVELMWAGGRPTDCLIVRLPITIILATAIANGNTATKTATYVDSCFGRVNIREDNDNQFVKGQLEYSPAYPIVESTN